VYHRRLSYGDSDVVQSVQGVVNGAKGVVQLSWQTGCCGIAIRIAVFMFDGITVLEVGIAYECGDWDVADMSDTWEPSSL
jgi:hypothetical protein